MYNASFAFFGIRVFGHFRESWCLWKC